MDRHQADAAQPAARCAADERPSRPQWHLRVERFFNRIKHCRRIATRYDKLAANYLAFVQLASIRLWLRVYEFTTLVRSVKGAGLMRPCYYADTHLISGFLAMAIKLISHRIISHSMIACF